MTDMADLFEPKPRWGLRGDPYLWAEMRDRLAGKACPQDRDDFLGRLDRLFEELVGVAPGAETRMVFVERYAHGGMSSGHVSLDWWCIQARPLLLQRWEDQAGFTRA